MALVGSDPAESDPVITCQLARLSMPGARATVLVVIFSGFAVVSPREHPHLLKTLRHSLLLYQR